MIQPLLTVGLVAVLLFLLVLGLVQIWFQVKDTRNPFKEEEHDDQP